MFESVTKKRKNPIFNIVGWSLLGVVCLIFVFVGFSPDTSFLGSNGAVATVNGEGILLSDYQRMYDRFQKQQQNRKMNPEQRRQMQQQVVENLVSRELLLQRAKKERITVSDLEIADAIKAFPAFQEDGKFSLVKYKEIIRSNPGLTEGRFESQISRDILVEKMYNIFQGSLQNMDVLRKYEEKVDQSELNLSYVKFPKTQLVDSKDVSAESAQTFLADHADKVKSYYNRNLVGKYTDKEQVEARHILIKTGPKKTEEEALALAKKVRSELNDENFASLAKKYSEDPGSKSRGGSLGYFTRGRMVKEFEETAFRLEKGTISEPVKTSFGFHIIQSTNKKPAAVKSFDTVKQEIARTLVKEEKAETALEDLKKKLADNSSLDSFLKQKKLRWQKTGNFSLSERTIGPLGPSEDFMKAAVGLSLKEPLLKRPIVKNDTVYLLKRAPLDSVKVAKKEDKQMDFFKQFMEQQSKNEGFQEWVEAMKKEATVKINFSLLR